MSWRIASSHSEFLKMISLCLAGGERAQFPPEVYRQVMDLWGRACELAYAFTTTSETRISGLRFMDEWEQSEIKRKIGVIIDVAESDFFTLEERQTRRVSFRRACKFVTGLSDGPDAEERFNRIFPTLSRGQKGLMQLEHYRELGFALQDVGLIRDLWLKLPKDVLRKTYEKSGRYRRNKQGRKKNPKK